MQNVGPITVLDNDGGVHVHYLWETPPGHLGDRWSFVLMEEDPFDESVDFVSLSLIPHDEGVWRVDSVDRNRADWSRGKRAPEALFEVALGHTGGRIVSSRKMVEGEAERRSDLADRMWDRWVARGIADYDQDLDRYEYIGAGSSP